MVWVSSHTTHAWLFSLRRVRARRRFLLGMWRPECVRGVNGDALGAVDGGGVAELNVVGDV